MIIHHDCVRAGGTRTDLVVRESNQLSQRHDVAAGSGVRGKVLPAFGALDDRLLRRGDAFPEQTQGSADAVCSRGEDAVAAELMCGGRDLLAPVVVVHHGGEVGRGQAHARGHWGR